MAAVLDLIIHAALSFDISSTIKIIGPSGASFSPGDAEYFLGSPESNADYQPPESRSIALRAELPRFSAASIPLTHITAYYSLVKKLSIRKENKWHCWSSIDRIAGGSVESRY